jgi:tetratricopeptide (TPR) repeat protein
MTLEKEINPQKRFVPALLPWVVAAGALVIYLLTLNHWVSFANLWNASRLSGWTWAPDRFGPLYWLVSYPLHWLPVTAIPLALNLFSAVCACLTLALLARSVALLPHDRTEAQRCREHGAFSILTIPMAWIAPVLAVMVCGFQLTFWESATGGSADMLDLLVFAYIVRCLLEFRIDEQQSWLSRAALLYGVAMSGHWAMMSFLPVFLIVLVWLKGLGFFNLSFLTRMSLWGLAGLSLYLLLPLVQGSSSLGHVPFWQALGANLKEHKGILSTVFSKRALFQGLDPLDPRPLWVLAVFFLLPLLAIGIKWPSYFGDPSRLGVAIASLMLHCFYGFLLVACIWVALDPKFSPRQILPPGSRIYYLAALSIGYFSGYFLLVFGSLPKRPQMIPVLLKYANKLVLLVFLGISVLTPATLIYRNFPQIQRANGPLLSEFGKLMLKDLPPRGAIVLSDDRERLLISQVAAAQAGRSKDYIFLDTASLLAPDYHRFLLKQYGEAWPVVPAKGELRRISDLTLMNVMSKLAQSNSLCYLHPSFGYYFELFRPEPHGLICYLIPTTNNVIEVNPSPELFAENRAVWDSIQPQLDTIASAVSPTNPPGPFGPLNRVVRFARLQKEVNPTLRRLGVLYSRSLVFLGVLEQRNGALKEAGEHFILAEKLNPDNIVAKVDLDCNGVLMNSAVPPALPSGAVEEKLGRYRNLQEVMRVNGPYDDPDLCYAQALAFARGGLYRQAIREFTRVKTLAPANLPARLFLARLQLQCRQPDQAISEVREIRSQAGPLGLSKTNMLGEVLSIETSANLARNDLQAAGAAVRAALDKYPNDEDLLSVASGTYINYHLYTNALELLDQQLQLAPDNATALVNKGYAFLQLKDYERAIPPLTRALTLQSTNYLALINRACAYLGADQLESAQQDYEALQKAFPKAFRVHYGLGEIAYRKKDTPNAIRYFQSYLDAVGTNNPSMKTEVDSVLARLKELKPGSS